MNTASSQAAKVEVCSTFPEDRKSLRHFIIEDSRSINPLAFLAMDPTNFNLQNKRDTTS